MATDTLKPEQFARFFQAVWGFAPFPWQADLLNRLAAGGEPPADDGKTRRLWPDVLDLPTGSGKTAALDIAVFHLALEAAKGVERRAPVRIAFIVDRRLIVDDAFERARHIGKVLRWSLLDDDAAGRLEKEKPDLAEALRRARAEPAVREAALRLRRLVGAGQPPLIARRLRGGVPREDDWARTPAQPTILCSTVDQVGSRLLFRGYGVSDTMKPIHAGLLGSDCLILLDEAHLSKPFRQTLDALKELRAPDKAPFEAALLTATPDSTGTEFGLSAADHAHPVLSDRLEASKPARLVEFAGRQGVDTEARRAEEIAASAKTVLAALRNSIANPAVGVVVNRVARARAVFERLEQELENAEVILLIGPARPVGRDKHAGRLDPIRTGRGEARRAMTKPLVVVATQTIEAGVDIDFDGLVTEAAALDALRQRFGRLNRAGRKIASEAVVLAHREDIGSRADDPVYEDRIAKTWEALQRIAATSDGIVDFGVTAFADRIPATEAICLAAPARDAPTLLPAYADLWSQTSPIPEADPEVALFLHGPGRSPASVRIVWRADIAEGDLVAEARQAPDRVSLSDLLALVPPRSEEAIEVPIWAARAFLRKQQGPLASLSDIAEREPAEADRVRSRPAFRYAGEDSPRTGVVHAGDLRNGDVIVVPAAYGGCDKWGWKPGSTDPVTDVADEAHRPFRGRRYAVRVTAALIAQGLRAERDEVGAAADDAEAIASELTAKLSDLREEPRERVLEAVLELDLPKVLRDGLAALRQARRRWEPVFPYDPDLERPSRGVVFIAPRGVDVAREGDDDADGTPPSTETEALGAASAQPLELVAHCMDVQRWARRFAAAAGLPETIAADLALAAFLHDAGKADPRYQAYYAGGDPYGPDAKGVLAKSGQRHLPRGAWERAGLPPDWRHEALSVRLAQLHPEFGDAHDGKLVLWLIGSHHGRGRPLFPHADDKDADSRPGLLKAYGIDADLGPGTGPQSLAFDFEGQDWAQMFEGLKRRYGIWGLARLEAFVRLADHRASQDAARPQPGEPRREAAE